MVRWAICEEISKKLNKIPSPNNTVQRYVSDISGVILQHVISEVTILKKSYAIQLDETTDVTNFAQLLVFVRYVGESGFKDNVLGKVWFQRQCLGSCSPFEFIQCLIYRFTVACKVLHDELSNVLLQVIKIVNNIKGSALNSKLFKLLYKDFGSDHI
ncbi:unnamed protein product [Lepeophtheirus salmonis]|uniref:(salmon louse) hypothetical protein n=1 Tax=Lepeophtheirus salmonis TaxID=72036 RepID=A0A7R8CFT2_LEPSM|nr:unnamed protein product [Lepeophtheirus salmonis]CAF2762814.1 unnamed protein product [Lepeophtheirus salmonis]